MECICNNMCKIIPKVKAKVPLVVAISVFSKVWPTVDRCYSCCNSHFGRGVFVHYS